MHGLNNKPLTDDERKALRRAQYKKRYDSDPKFAKQVRKRALKRYHEKVKTTPELLEHKRAYGRTYAQEVRDDPEKKANQRDCSKAWYDRNKGDPEFLKERSEYQKKRYHTGKGKPKHKHKKKRGAGK